MILVTGGLGFVGSHTARAFLDQGHDCVITTHRSQVLPSFLRDIPADRLTLEPLDVTDRSAWEAVGRKHAITGIVHLAAADIALPALQQLTMNIAGMVAGVEFAKAYGVPRMTVASTIGVYAADSQAASPLREDSPLCLGAPHAIPASKKAMEIIADLVGRSAGPEVVSMRLPAVWGPLGNPSSPFFGLPGLVHAAAKVASQSPTIRADNGIDLVYVSDVARAIVTLQSASNLRHRVYNIGSGRPTTNAQVAEALTVLRTGFVPELVSGASHEPSWLDVGRLRGDTGFTEAVDLATGLEFYLTWLEGGNER